ncbi:MAG TPA: DUF3617 family protein [Xanthobacteraceae bacterium]|nr:DUF3617 family protein [Xanthobacteraceae bacterium]
MPYRSNALILSCLLVAATLAAPAARADGLEAGLWRSNQTVTLNGNPVPPRETMRCLRDAEVNDLERTFSPVYGTTNSACEQTEQEFTPQRLKWRLQCRGQLDMDVAGEFVFERRDRYTATIVASSSMLGKLMQETHTRIEAERVGECK